MSRTVYLLVIFVLLLAVTFLGYRWGALLVEGSSIIVLLVLLPLLSLVIYKGALMQGRRSIETEAHRTAVLNLQGPEAVAAGRRLIVLGRCVVYFCVALSWIFFLAFVVL